MQPTPPPLSARNSPNLLVLCLLLWLVALLSAAGGLWLLARGEWPLAALLLLLSAALAAAGLGLYRLRRWGVILFGGLALLGSISYLAGMLERFNDLSGMDLAAALGALVSILAAFLVPLGLIYVTLVLWRQTK